MNSHFAFKYLVLCWHVVVYAASLSWHQKSASPMVVEAGVDVTLKCHAEGTPSPVVSWTQHGSPVTPGPTRALGHHGRLRLFNVQPSDTGAFVCHVTNYISTLEAEIHVVVPSAGMADGEAPHESAGVNSNVVTVDRIAGGVDALKNQVGCVLAFSMLSDYVFHFCLSQIFTACVRACVCACVRACIKDPHLC